MIMIINVEIKGTSSIVGGEASAFVYTDSAVL